MAVNHFTAHGIIAGRQPIDSSPEDRPVVLMDERTGVAVHIKRWMAGSVLTMEGGMTKFEPTHWKAA